MAFSDHLRQQDQARQQPAPPKPDAAPAPAPAAAKAAPPPAQTSADPDAPAPGGYDLGQFHFGFTNRGTPGVSYPPPGGSFWSLTGPGWGPGSQGEHDVINRFTNNVLYGGADPITSKVAQTVDPSNPAADLAALRTQREKMNASMSPAAKATADIAAQFSPSNVLLNRFGGPTAQGAVQQGLTSVNQGNDLETAGKDAVIGAATGKVAQLGSAALNPANVGWGAGKIVENIPAAVGLKFGGMGGGWAADKFSKGFVEPAARRVEDAVTNYMPDIGPYGRNLVQNAIIGGGQTALDTDAGNVARQNVRSYLSPDWSAAGTALQNLRGMLPF